MRPETISYIEWFGCAFCSIRVAKIVNDIYTHLEDVAANGTGGLAACGKPFILKKCNHFVRSEKKAAWRSLTKQGPWNFFLHVLHVSLGSWQVSWWITV